jgi:hypothetical protein
VERIHQVCRVGEEDPVDFVKELTLKSHSSGVWWVVSRILLGVAVGWSI